jgi:hypothetical protein
LSFLQIYEEWVVDVSGATVHYAKEVLVIDEYTWAEERRKWHRRQGLLHSDDGTRKIPSVFDHLPLLKKEKKALIAKKPKEKEGADD